MGDAVRECEVLQRKVELLENQLKQLQNENSTTQQSIASPTNVSSVSRPLSYVLANGDDVGLSTSWNRLVTERAKVILLLSNLPIANIAYVYRNSDQHLCQ